MINAEKIISICRHRVFQQKKIFRINHTDGDIFFPQMAQTAYTDWRLPVWILDPLKKDNQKMGNQNWIDGENIQKTRPSMTENGVIGCRYRNTVFSQELSTMEMKSPLDTRGRYAKESRKAETIESVSSSRD